jgi:hypothetical protein
MLKSYRNSSKFTVLVLLITLLAFGCKSRKKTAELNAAAAEKAKMEQEAKMRQQQADEQRAKEEQERKDIEARAQAAAAAKASTPAVKLGQYFDSIAGAGNIASANSSINEALGLFESPDTPVLIIISEEGGQKDYDKPTTIKAYLNYLKDQKKNMNKVENLQFNGSGKISEVELKKN